MSERKSPLSIKLSPDLKSQLQAEAERLGRSASSHGEAVIADHLAGHSMERVRQELAEQTAEVAGLREALKDHTAAIHLVLRTVVFQLPGVQDEDLYELVDKHFEALRGK